MRKRKPYPVSFLVRSGETRMRIPTGITVTDSDLSSNGKRIRNITKAQFIETKRRVLQDSLDAVMLDTLGLKVDAEYIVEHLLSINSNLDFFTFVDDWLEHATIKGERTMSACWTPLKSTSVARHCLSLPSLTSFYLTMKNHCTASHGAVSLSWGDTPLYRETKVGLSSKNTKTAIFCFIV